ncbi:MAG: ferrochelatase [Chlorobiales bacterium]|jgi:protoporphyrin/coproporphyrin ferrochelatase|nr:ferrochelatase [Chlorobiales bacterium]
MKKIMVVIATYGEVEDPTLKNLLPNSRRIIEIVTSQVADLSKLMRTFIAYFRSFKRNWTWTRAGYHSRLVKINEAQTALIATQLGSLKESLGEEFTLEVKDAYFFVPPYFEDVIANHPSYDAVVVVSMFPIESAFSCGVACKTVRDTWGEKAFEKIHVIGSLWDDAELMRIYTDHVFKTMAQFGETGSGEKKGLVLAVHGTLVRDSNGNPSKVQTGFDATMAFYEKVKAAILADPRSDFADIKLGCLNHRYGGTWTPDTLEKAFDDFKQSGIDSVSLFPFGFFADNSEVDFEAKRKLEGAGFKKNQYIECMNASPEFAGWVAKKIYGKLFKIIGMENAIRKVGAQA